RRRSLNVVERQASGPAGHVPAGLAAAEARKEVDTMRRAMTRGGVLAVLASLACALGGSATARNLATPNVTGFSPKSGVIGTEVKLTGTDLQGARVDFGGAPAGTVTVDPGGTWIVATVGRETQMGPVKIT